MLPQLAQDLGHSLGEVAYVITSFSIAYGLFQLLHGPMGDYAGKLRWIRFATWVAALASAACMLAASLHQLLALRFFAGAACAALIPLSLAWIGDAVPYQARQVVLARFMTGSTAGAVFGQVAGGVMADTLGWRWSFALPALVLLWVALMLSWEARKSLATATLHKTPALPESTQDVSRGQHISAPTDRKRPSLRTILREFELVLSLSWARVILGVVFLEGLLAYAAFAYVPSWLHLQFQMPLWQAGLAAAGFGLGGVIYSLLARYLIAYLGERGLVVTGAGLFALGLIGIGGTIWLKELSCCLLMGLGFFMVHNTLQVQATQMSPDARGTAIAAFAVGLFSGQSIGVALGAPIMGHLGFAWLQVGSACLFFLLGSLTAYLLDRRQGVSQRRRP